MPRAATSTDVFNAITELRRREIIAILVDGKEHPVGDVVQKLRMRPTCTIEASARASQGRDRIGGEAGPASSVQN